MKLVAAAACCMLLAASPGPSEHAKEEPKVDVKTAFAGNTISAMAYLLQKAPVPGSGATGVDSLKTIMFKAYLDASGRARVTTWNPRSQRYNNTVEDRWRVDGDVVCLSGRSLGLRQGEFCFETLVWGPVFAGRGTTLDATVKGDVRPGNADQL